MTVSSMRFRFAPDVSVMFYNKEHFKAAGLDPSKGPETWTELVDYAQKLTRDGHYGYTYAAAVSRCLRLFRLSGVMEEIC